MRKASAKGRSFLLCLKIDSILTISATSSLVPGLPAGISSKRLFLSKEDKCAFICVSMNPQAMAFTEIPLGATSLANALVKAFTPPLLAEYATSVEAPTLPHTEEILTMRPLCLAIICGRTAREASSRASAPTSLSTT